MVERDKVDIPNMTAHFPGLVQVLKSDVVKLALLAQNLPS
jgi:hypothetical protein